jgi:hypothetical protein
MSVGNSLATMMDLGQFFGAEHQQMRHQHLWYRPVVLCRMVQLHGNPIFKKQTVSLNYSMSAFKTQMAY